MRIVLILLLLQRAVARPQQALEDGNSVLNEKDYEADNADQELEREKVLDTDAQVESAPRPADERPYRLVDYAGNTFLQRSRAPADEAVAAATLSEDQNLDYESDASANSNEKGNLPASKRRLAGLRTNRKEQISSNRSPVDMYALEADDQEHDSDDQEGLTPQNNAHSCRNILRGRGIIRGDKTKGKSNRNPAKQPDEKTRQNSPQSNYEGVGVDHRHDMSHDNSVMNHNVRPMGIGNEKEQEEVADYGTAESDQSAANVQEPEVLLKQNIEARETENKYSDYEGENSENDDTNRDRRSAKDVEMPKPSNTEEIDNSKPALPAQETLDDRAGAQNFENVEAKEQMAIKRHIANLTNDQLDELLASLSADKRELLQEIIGNDKAEVIKRELAKKDETIQTASVDDENQSGTAKVKTQESSIQKESEISVEQEPDIITHNKLAKEAMDTKEDVEISSKKDVEENHDNYSEQQSVSSNESEMANDKNVKNSGGSNEIIKGDDSSAVSNQQNSEADSDRSNVKREIRTDDYEQLYDSEDLTNSKGDEESLVSPTDEELTHDNDQSEFNHDIQLSKRDTLKDKQVPAHKLEESISEQLRALEDSFPSVRSYDETNYQGFKMSPLVRVKRNKRENEKRSAVALSESQASYIPYRADTEDEDDDEGNEFEDDGFFDRTSNLNRGNVQSCASHKESSFQENSSNDASIVARRESDKLSNNFQIGIGETEGLNKIALSKTDDKPVASGGSDYIDESNKQKKIEGGRSDGRANQDLNSMGSDTDNVLSGSEGADENLMLTSAARSRLSRDSDKDLNSLSEGRELEDSKRTAAEDLQSVQNDPNGAFGGLPKNYDGELSRYKRIRRTKQVTSAA